MAEIENSWSLLSCPFCGGRPELTVSPHYMNDSYNQIRIKCTKCHITTTPYIDGRSVNGHIVPTSEVIEKAVIVWNKRADVKNIVHRLSTVDEEISETAQLIRE